MQTVTQIHMAPEDIRVMFSEMLTQLSGTRPVTGPAIPVNELPAFSAAMAAHYLGCSPAHLGTIVQRHPDILKPIVKKGKATKYDPRQLFEIKSKNLVK